MKQYDVLSPLFALWNSMQQELHQTAFLLHLGTHVKNMKVHVGVAPPPEAVTYTDWLMVFTLGYKLSDEHCSAKGRRAEQSHRRVWNGRL